MDISSLTRIYDRYIGDCVSTHLILSLYKEINGNPSSYGIELCSLLNSIGDDFKDVGCLSAKIVAHFKNKYDDISIKDCSYDYLYAIYVDNKKVTLTCMCSERGLIYSGTPTGFIDFMMNDIKPSEDGRIPIEDDLIGNFK